MTVANRDRAALRPWLSVVAPLAEHQGLYEAADHQNASVAMWYSLKAALAPPVTYMSDLRYDLHSAVAFVEEQVSEDIGALGRGPWPRVVHFVERTDSQFHEV